MTDNLLYLKGSKQPNGPENPPGGPKNSEYYSLGDKVFFATLYGVLVLSVVSVFGGIGYMAYDTYQRDQISLEERRERLRQEIRTFESELELKIGKPSTVDRDSR